MRRSKSDSRVLQVVVVSFQCGYFFANHARACHEPASQHCCSWPRRTLISQEEKMKSGAGDKVCGRHDLTGKQHRKGVENHAFRRRAARDMHQVTQRFAAATTF